MIPDGLPRTTIEMNRRRFGTFSWQGQAPQYDQLGPKGEIVYRQYFDGGYPINTLLYYDNTHGQLIGFLNHYPYEVAQQGPGDPLQTAQSANVFLHPDLTGTEADRLFKKLVAEGKRRWPQMVEPDMNPLNNTEFSIKKPVFDQGHNTGLQAGSPLMDGNRRASRIGRRS